MKLTWYGHSCFRLESADGTAVFDPYEPGFVPGLKLPEIEAAAIFCSHDHGDHNYAKGVREEYVPFSMKVSRIPVCHDHHGGAHRGKNLITVLETEGRRIVFAGDLGHPLTGDQIEAVGKPDLLMIPVGGFYTIDADEAYRVCGQLKPEKIVPMHYRTAEFGLTNIAAVEPFLAKFGAGEVKRLAASTCDPFEEDERVLVFTL